MIFLSEFIEWSACLTEGGLFYWLAGKVFKDERRNVRRCWDWIFTAGFAAVILGINNIVLYSTFTLLIWVLFGSMSAAVLYRVSCIKLLSFAMFYTVCFCATDMLASNLYLSFGNRLNINGDTIMAFSPQRIGLLIFAKSFMIVFIVSLRKLLIPLFRSGYEKMILLVSVIAFLLFLYYREPAQSRFSVELSSIFGLLVVLCSLGQPEIDKGTGRWITDKADRTRHGWVMQSVKSTLEKYNGTMQFQFHEDELRITAILFF